MSALKLKDTAVVVCVDMREPWNIISDLLQWFGVVREIYAEYLEPLPEETKEQFWNGPEASKSTQSAYRVPIIVVVTRCDAVSSWLDRREFYGWVDAIECYLRRECIAYNASLVYTMVSKHARNVGFLYNYLGYLLGRFPLAETKIGDPDLDPDQFQYPIFLAGTDNIEAVKAAAPDIVVLE